MNSRLFVTPKILSKHKQNDTHIDTYLIETKSFIILSEEVTKIKEWYDHHSWSFPLYLIQFNIQNQIS